jgi:glycerol uptake facilitator protein
MVRLWKSSFIAQMCNTRSFSAIACGRSDAHLNPAVTMGFAVSSGHFAKFAPYLIAQMAGAFTGAILVWLHFLPHWEQTPIRA